MEEEDRPEYQKILENLAEKNTERAQKDFQDYFIRNYPNGLKKCVFNYLTKEPQTVEDIRKKTKSNHQRVQAALYWLVENRLCDVEINRNDKRTIYKFYLKIH